MQPLIMFLVWGLKTALNIDMFACDRAADVRQHFPQIKNNASILLPLISIHSDTGLETF